MPMSLTTIDSTLIGTHHLISIFVGMTSKEIKIEKMRSLNQVATLIEESSGSFGVVLIFSLALGPVGLDVN